MKKEISFMHAADLHLDSPFKGLSYTPEHIFRDIKESTFNSLDNLVKAAIQKRVDFVLITGDLFDNEKQSLKAQVRLRRAFEELKRHQIHVYLSYGNHDYINGNIHPVTYPDNVFIFPDENISDFIFKKAGKAIAKIYGFSYENRAVLEEKAKDYKVKDRQIPFHIAMLHGSIRSNTEHDVYSPFQLTDLQKEPFDYWALGHIHKREVLKEKPPIVYPGNIQGRNRKETGEKGCYHVVLSETDINLSFIPLQAFTIHPVYIDVSQCEDLYEIERCIQEEINSRQLTGNELIDLTLTGRSTLRQWENDKLLEELVEVINEPIAYAQPWKYIFRVVTEVKEKKADIELRKGDHFIGELIRQVDYVSVQANVKELYHHKQARRYLVQLTNEEEQIMKEEAKELLFNQLFKGGSE
ncbi:metallophosphoesterase family protein [Oceanobacillus salinisoli]|uniref:metallophosphoesterase family protein n=1 Tax=Oceanobacillus salinisoli TaxID=2678611 RepID=UPI0012E190CB|nr:DNA repair exonuclease [Oceanobacillus salinisoli]